jgi:hypothetical protein
MAILLLVFITHLVPVASSAQSPSPEILAAGKRVDAAFDQNLKGWTRERGTPIQGSSNVIIENWKTYDRGVKISIGMLGPDFKTGEFLRNDPTSRVLELIGDEAAIWGYFGNVTFRSGRVAVSVSSGPDLNLLSQNEDENRAMSRKEAAATSRLIACFVNLALNGYLTQDKPIPRQGFLQRPSNRNCCASDFWEIISSIN